MVTFRLEDQWVVLCQMRFKCISISMGVAEGKWTMETVWERPLLNWDVLQELSKREVKIGDI
jgi:hypothetical protein